MASTLVDQPPHIRDCEGFFLSLQSCQHSSIRFLHCKVVLSNPAIVWAHDSACTDPCTEVFDEDDIARCCRYVQMAPGLAGSAT